MVRAALGEVKATVGSVLSTVTVTDALLNDRLAVSSASNLIVWLPSLIPCVVSQEKLIGR